MPRSYKPVPSERNSGGRSRREWGLRRERSVRIAAVDQRDGGLASAVFTDQRRQLLGGLRDEIAADRGEPFDYQKGVPRCRGQLGPLGLLPVPAPAEGAEIVPVDDLAGLRRGRLGPP